MSIEEVNIERRKRWKKEYMKKYKELHKEELESYKRKWELEHKDQTKQRKKKWYDEHKDQLNLRKKEKRKCLTEEEKERLKQMRKEWAKNNKDKMKEYKRKWRLKNKEIISQKAKMNFEYKEKKNKKAVELYYYLRDIVLTHYGGNPPRCNCCGEMINKFLTIDHIDGGGTKELVGKFAGNIKSFLKSIIIREFPPIYQILCYNCNLGRSRSKNKNICPHKETNKLMNSY